jgi:hypothetical protein
MFARSPILCLLLVSLLSLRIAQSASAAPAGPSHSPSDRAIERAAIEAAELSPSRTRSLRLRLHLAPLLPQLRVTFGRGWQLGTSRDFFLDTPTTDNDRVNYALSAHWDLARLVMPHEELALAKEEQRRAMLRLRLAERVARLLAERCQLHHQGERLSRSEEQRQLAVEATLTVLTGGKALPAVAADEACPAPPLRLGVPTTITSGTPSPEHSRASASDPAESIGADSDSQEAGSPDE